MRISQIFYSIQGEGRNMNVPTVFVRFQGCNLNPGCVWCDTQYARKEGGREMSPVDVLNAIKAYDAKCQGNGRGPHVCITGGEPLHHYRDVMLLIGCLLEPRCFTEIFTNGSLPPPPWIRQVDTFVADIKCPSSGVESKELQSWFEARPNDQVKFVVADEQDLTYVKSLHPEQRCRPEVVISPMIPVHETKDGQPMWTLPNVEWARRVVEFCKQYGYRFSWQQQKLLWGNRKDV